MNRSNLFYVLSLYLEYLNIVFYVLQHWSLKYDYYNKHTCKNSVGLTQAHFKAWWKTMEFPLTSVRLGLIHYWSFSGVCDYVCTHGKK